METKPLLIAAAIFHACLASSQAAITTLYSYQMGEDAPGTDSVGGFNLAVTGTLPSVASGVAGSSSALDFGNLVNAGTPESTAANFLDSAVLPTIPANWGIEMWIRPETLPNGVNQGEVGLVHLGGTGGGIAIEMIAGAWMIQATGVGVTTHNAGTGVAAPTAGDWTHLVYVNQGGTATFYVNGVASSTAVNAVAPSNQAPHFTLGSMWSNNRRGFDGQMDAVRLFTFNTGEFNINDTFVNGVPEPGAALLSGLGLLALVGRRRR